MANSWKGYAYEAQMSYLRLHPGMVGPELLMAENNYQRLELFL